MDIPTQNGGLWAIKEALAYQAPPTVLLLFSTLISYKFSKKMSYLIFIDFRLFKFGLALLLESDNDQGDENVDKEKGKDDEVDDVKDGHFHTK